MQKIKTSVRILWVVDATESMSPYISTMKEFMKNSYNKIKVALGEAARAVEYLEIQIATFRDLFEEKGDEAFHMSKIFRLPEDEQELISAIDEIQCFGGGDDPESSMQALYLALKRSPQFNKYDAQKSRYIIMLATDALTHSFEEFEKRGGKTKFPDYPDDELPKSLDEFYDEYHRAQNNIFKTLGIEPKDVRLNLFAPLEGDFSRKTGLATWNNVTSQNVMQNNNLKEIKEDALLASIVASY